MTPDLDENWGLLFFLVFQKKGGGDPNDQISPQTKQRTDAFLLAVLLKYSQRLISPLRLSRRLHKKSGKIARILDTTSTPVAAVLTNGTVVSILARKLVQTSIVGSRLGFLVQRLGVRD
jgi:hypothetical protein